MNSPPRFLSVNDVLTLHAIAIEDQGGDPALRDRGLLESAVAMPAQQFGGQYVHEDTPAMAAAYAFHICRNHPFVDGNKRAAAAAMIAFLSDNDWSFDATADEAETAFLQLAAGQLDKSTFTEWARQQMHQKPTLELRRFFSELTWDQVQRMAESVVAAGSDPEAEATVADATRSIPLIHTLRTAATRAKVEHHDESYAYINAMYVLLTALYRIAEDMGYEW